MGWDGFWMLDVVEEATGKVTSGSGTCDVRMNLCD